MGAKPKKMNRREFFVGLGGVFAATNLVKTPRLEESHLVYYEKWSPDGMLVDSRVIDVSVWVGAPHSNLECKIEGSVSPEGPWSPIEMFTPPRSVQAVYVDGKPAAFRLKREVKYEEDDEDREEEEVEERGAEEGPDAQSDSGEAP